MDISIEMLEHMDAQDVFDVVAWHMLRQGERACDGFGHCLYRAPRGMRCAIGWLIPDSLYCPAFEHRYVHDLARELAGSWFGQRFARFLTRYIEMLHELQQIHDGRDPADWPADLRMLGQRAGLDIGVVDRFPVPARAAAPAAPPVTTFDLYALLVAPPLLPSFTFAGIDHGSEKREKAREVLCA